MTHVPSTNWKARNKATWSCFILSSHLFLSMNPCWAAPGLFVDCPSKGLARLFHGLLAQHLAGLKLQMSKGGMHDVPRHFAIHQWPAIVFEDNNYSNPYQSLSIGAYVTWSPICGCTCRAEIQAFASTMALAVAVAWQARFSGSKVHAGLTSVRWNKLNAFEQGKMYDFFWRSQEKTLTRQLHIPSSNI